MSRNVRCGLIQASNAVGTNRSLPEIKKAMIDKHLKLIEQAAKKKVKILCLQKFYFTPGDMGYPVFETKYARVGVYICYDRHFPEGARVLGLNGAEIVFNPSATVAGLSEYLWELEQPAHAAANGYFVGAINRVGREKPWNIGEVYGKSYFCNPRGNIVAQP